MQLHRCHQNCWDKRSSPTPSLKCERARHCFLLARMLFQPGCAMEMVPSTHGSGDHSITRAQAVEWKSFHHEWFFTSLVTYLHIKHQRNSHSLVLHYTALSIPSPIRYWSLCLWCWFGPHSVVLLSIFSQTKHLQLHQGLMSVHVHLSLYLLATPSLSMLNSQIPGIFSL